MAHFAKITETNEVLTVLTLNNSDMLNSDGVEEESVGQAYLEQHNNWPAHLWIQNGYHQQVKNQNLLKNKLHKTLHKLTDGILAGMKVH